MAVADISLFELDVFMSISRLKSIKSACRVMNLNPSNVSKILQKIETKVGARLLARSRMGVTLTPEGVIFLKTAEQILELAPDLNIQLKAQNSFQESTEVIGIAALSFVCTRLVSPCVGSWYQEQSKVRYRVVEFTHNKLSDWAGKEAFDVAIHIESFKWPKQWVSEKLGSFSWGLYAKSDHPLSMSCNTEQVLRYPFVVPTGWSERDGEYVVGEDQCPVPLAKRLRGSEATTAENALEIVQSTQHLSFVPELSTAHLIKAGKLKRITVTDWPVVKRNLYITVNADKIKKSTLTMIKSALKEQLSLLRGN